MQKTKKIAVSGAGLIGKRHVKRILQCEATELCAIVDPTDEAKAYAKTLGQRWYASTSDLFAHEKPDGIVVSTPNNTHLSIGLECISAGCPLLMEKPITTTSSEGSILVSAAKEAGIPLLVGHYRRHNPLVKIAYKAIADGEIGKIRTVHANCWLYKPDYYFEESPWRKEKGAGPIAVNMVHDVDLIRHLCGDVVCVHAIATKSLRGFENEDAAAVVLRFESGALCTITVSDTVVSPWSWELTAHENPAYPPTNESCYLLGGSHGSLSLPDLRLWKNEGDKSGVRDWWQPIKATSLLRNYTDPLMNQIIHFVDVIDGKQKPLISGEEGLKTLQVIESIQKSVETKKTIHI